MELRRQHKDANIEDVTLKQIYDWTVGLNWLLSANMKCQFNYIVEHRNMPGVPEGWINGFGLRAGYDF